MLSVEHKGLRNANRECCGCDASSTRRVRTSSALSSSFHLVSGVVLSRVSADMVTLVRRLEGKCCRATLVKRSAFTETVEAIIVAGVQESIQIGHVA